MKKTLLIVVALFMSSFAFSQFQFGVGGAFGSKSGVDDDGDLKMGFGPHVRALYNISEDFGVVGGFTYFFGKEVMDKTANFYEFNVDAQYSFFKEDNIKAYALGGVNYTGAHWDETNWGFGFHVGGGAKFGKFFVEVKYDFEIDNDDFKREGQIAGTVGIYIN